MVEWKPDEQFLEWLQRDWSKEGFLDEPTAVSHPPPGTTRTIADYVEVFRQKVLSKLITNNQHPITNK